MAKNLYEYRSSCDRTIARALRLLAFEHPIEKAVTRRAQGILDRVFSVGRSCTVHQSLESEDEVVRVACAYFGPVKQVGPFFWILQP